MFLIKIKIDGYEEDSADIEGEDEEKEDPLNFQISEDSKFILEKKMVS